MKLSIKVYLASYENIDCYDITLGVFATKEEAQKEINDCGCGGRNSEIKEIVIKKDVKVTTMLIGSDD